MTFFPLTLRIDRSLYQGAFVMGALALAPFASAGSNEYSFTPLTRSPRSYYYASGQALAAAGTVVFGTTDTGSQNSSGAFSWRAGETKLLPSLSEGYGAQAYAASADGSVVVGTGSSSRGTEATRWRNGIVEGLGDPAGGGYYSVATDVSADGHTIVGYGSGVGGYDALRWQDGVMVRLGGIPTGFRAESAQAISADGKVIVGNGSSTLQSAEAFRWSEEGFVTLGDLPGGSILTNATDVSADGSVVVGNSSGYRGAEAMLWRNGKMIGLGVFETPYPFSMAHAVSADGSVVVGVAERNYEAVAFVWDAVNGMQDLNDVFLRAQVLPDKWKVTFAYDVYVTPEGTTIITGAAKDRYGDGHAFLATIPSLPRFQPIGALPGGPFRSVARALSKDGATVVGASESSTGPRAFVWTSKRGLFDIGAGALDATGVSGDGSVVVGPANLNRAFRWTNAGTVSILGTYAKANATSADGNAVVGSLAPNGANETVYRWTPTTTERYVTYMGTRAVPARANAVSANGSVFAGSILPHTFGGAAYTSRAFLWRSAGGQQALGDLPGGIVESEATAISADGSVVVGWSRSTNGPEAFRWTSTGGMVGLGDLPGPGFASRATAVSPDGRIVLGTGVANGKNRVFIWDATNGMRDLQNVMAARGLTAALSGWTITGATGLTNGPAGTLIVAGTAIDPQGRTQAFWSSLPPVVATVQP